MPRARRAAERQTKLLNFHAGLKSSGVYRVDCRMENDVDKLFFEQRSIALEIPRIGGKVLARTKLSRIDEDRDNHSITPLAGRPHQSKMPFMQKSHCRNQDETTPLAPLGFAPVTHGRKIVDDFHDQKIGVLEYWSDGVLGGSRTKPKTPLLHHSITPILSERVLLQ